MRVGSRRGQMAVIAMIGAASLVLAGCSDSSSSDGGDTTDLTKSTTDLGTKNEATGSPVKIGAVSWEAPDSDARMTGYRIAAQYVNEYLGGLNGHEIVLDECANGNTPAGATACGVQFGKDGVVAVLDSNDGQSLATFKGLDGAPIPYLTQLSADTDVLGGSTSFVMFNPLGLGSATIAVAKDKKIDKAAFVMPDLPSTTGPVKALAGPQYEAAGIGFDIVAISEQTADPTSAIQQAINKGAGQLVFFGDTEFVVTGIKVAKQLGFKGPLITQVTGFPADQIASIPGGLEGVITLGSASQDPDSDDRKLYNTVVKEYAGDLPTDGNFTTGSYQTLMSLVDALALTPDAGGDAASVLAAMSKMPRPVPLRLGGGITFQCGVAKIAVLPGVCVGETLRSDLDADGNATDEEVLTQADAG